MLNEARQNRRRKVSSLVTLDDGAGPVDLPIGDVSRGGLFLKSDLLLEEGERYRLSFVLPGTAELVRGQAEVVRVQALASLLGPAGPVDSGMGLRFLDLEPPGEQALCRWLEG